MCRLGARDVLEPHAVFGAAVHAVADDRKPDLGRHTCHTTVRHLIAYRAANGSFSMERSDAPASVFAPLSDFVLQEAPDAAATWTVSANLGDDPGTVTLGEEA